MLISLLARETFPYSLNRLGTLSSPLILFCRSDNQGMTYRGLLNAFGRMIIPDILLPIAYDCSLHQHMIHIVQTSLSHARTDSHNYNLAELSLFLLA